MASNTDTDASARTTSSRYDSSESPLSPIADEEGPDVELFKPLAIQTMGLPSDSTPPTSSNGATYTAQSPTGGFHPSPASIESRDTGGFSNTLLGDSHFIGTSEGRNLLPFEYAALQLLEESSAKQNEVSAILPELQMILSGDLKGSIKDAAETKVKKWVDKQKQIKERKRPTRKTQLSGWLKKVGTSKLTSTRRWVVLDGQTLMYFRDDTEAELKGVLQLSGCCCYYSKSIADPRKYVFAITSSDSSFDKSTKDVTESNENLDTANHQRNKSTPLDTSSLNTSLDTTDTSTISTYDEDDYGNISSFPALNPLHESKSKYRWAAVSEDDRKRWVEAINMASSLPPIEGECLLWAKHFGVATNGLAYRRVLRQLAQRPTLGTSLLRRTVSKEAQSWYCLACDTGSVSADQRLKFLTQSGWLCVSADWVRTMQQVSCDSSQYGKNVHHSKKKSGLFKRKNKQKSDGSKSGGANLGEKPPLAPGPKSQNGLPSPPKENSFSGGSSASSPNSPCLPSPVVCQHRYTRSADSSSLNGPRSSTRVFQTDQSIGDDTVTSVAKRSKQRMSHLAQQAVAVASASRHKRRMGFTPGERVSIKQLDRDLIRDVVELNIYIVSPLKGKDGHQKDQKMNLAYFGELPYSQERTIIPVLHDRYEQCDSNWLLKTIADRLLHSMKAVSRWESFVRKWETYPPQRRVEESLEFNGEDRSPETEITENTFQALNSLLSTDTSTTDCSVSAGSGEATGYRRKVHWPDLSNTHVEARCLEFAREVLLCSSRYVRLFDVGDFLLHSRSLSQNCHRGRCI
eukprot:gb/GECG01010567.1/.p1 GENE.gb/GECG01010567.1/~~gb/GECG01010567.1/.p1  ORF type:complete len:800 (+),score=93.51 gb/GECG01010567.1/:1-2400(+)